MPHEKRIGQRMPLGDLSVTWRLDAEKAAKARRRQRPGARPPTAYLRDVSATGAALVAPTDKSLDRGAMVNVDVSGLDISFAGRVRRALVTEDPEWTYYGLEIIQGSPGLNEWLRGLMEEARGGVVTESQWRSSF